MKKIYVLAAFLGASTFAFNQAIQKEYNFTKEVNVPTKAVPSPNYEKAQGAVLWTDDFDTTQAAEWTATKEAGTQGDWKMGDEQQEPFAGTYGQPSYWLPLRSVTDENGVAYFTSLKYAGAPSIGGVGTQRQNAQLEMNTSVDCSSEEYVVFEFYQSYRPFNYDSVFVQVSLDGGVSWGTAVNPNSGAPGNEFVRGADTLQRMVFSVNNSANVKFRFGWAYLEATAQGVNMPGGYAWVVDDVTIYALDDNDINVVETFYGVQGDPTIFAPAQLFRYHRIPLAQAQPITTMTAVESLGSAQQTNVTITVNDSIGGTYTSSSTPQSLAAFGIAGNYDTLQVDNAFTPSANGTYKLKTVLTADQTDDNPSNNTIDSYTFIVGDYLYAKDKAALVPSPGEYSSSIYSGKYTVGGVTMNIIEAGNWFEIAQQADLTGIDFQFGDTLSIGSEVIGKLYEVTVTGTDLNYNLVGQTLPYQVQSGDKGTYHTLVFENPQTLNQGLYLITATCPETFSIATVGEADHSVGTRFYASEAPNPAWGALDNTPVVRMNFDPTLAVAEDNMLNIGLTQYPNPFANETTVSFNLQEATSVSYTVTNLAGQVIITANEGNLTAGEHSITIDGASLTNGVYFLKLQTEEGQVTRKMVVNK